MVARLPVSNRYLCPCRLETGTTRKQGDAMTRRFYLLLSAVAGLSLLGATPALDVEELLRQGNAAFDRHDYEAAIKCYTEAEDRAIDPGQVAYNKATAFYRLGVAEEKNPGRQREYFQAAEEHYRQSCAGADEQRRIRGLFGLGNSLLQGRGENARALREAAHCYRACLASPDRALAADARHNLELARLRWFRARLRDAGKNPENRNPNDPERNPSEGPRKNGTDQEPVEQGDRTQGQAGVKKGSQPTQIRQGEKPIETPETTPGQGNLDPITGDADQTTLTPEEAARELKKAVEQIEEVKERRSLRTARPPAGTIKDW
jgi:tetratricopeptide (TPR) repeat protein